MKVNSAYSFFLILTVFSALLQTASGKPCVPPPLSSISIIVSGRILNDSTGNPVKNHNVLVKVPYAGYTNTVNTDSNGYYADTIRSLTSLGDTLSVSTYDCHNVLHIQSQAIESYSIIINFFICETYSPICVADFISELDSSSVSPCQYHFLDLSKGNPDHWLWDFGDGLSSSIRNPMHTYAKTGQYKVCLTITRSALKTPCSDSVCKYIYTPAYYSIGGHIFAGDHPINNPVSTGDTGIAYLYKFLHNYVIAFDTSKFTYLGYFSFPYLLTGDYFVKVVLTPGSTNALKYIPMYFSQQAFWQQSQLLGVADSSVFDFDIRLKKANDSIKGNGIISGRVGHHTQSTSTFNLALSEVLLLDSLKNIITYKLSDASGNFRFPDLPFGRYFLFVESTGRFSKFTAVTISADSPFADSVLVEIYDRNILGINEITGKADVVAGLPFPNPSTGNISIPVTVKKQVELVCSVLSIQSVALIESRSDFTAGSYILQTDLSALSPGIYILVLRTASGEKISTRKIIKY
ncbi:MAG: PKD domain-containing protein [Bacteroidota bacterium]|jgi:PKD repeat protein